MSEFLKLNSRDFLKGLVLSGVVAGLTTLLQLLNGKGFNLSVEDLQVIGTATVVAFVSYLLKNLATDADGKVGGAL